MAKDPRFKRISPESERETNKVSGKEVYNNTITNNHLIDGSVTNAKLANDSVTADKIAAGAVSTSEINTAAEPTVGTIYSNGWFRSNGATGWYNQTYGGGIWMEDSTYVKVYNGKAFMPSAGSGDNGIIFPPNPGGGGGDYAIIKYYPYDGENTAFIMETGNDSGDYFYINRKRFDGANTSILLQNTLVLTAPSTLSVNSQASVDLNSIGGGAGGIYSFRDTTNGGFGIHHFSSSVGGYNSLKAYVNGNGDFIKASDIKIKENIKPARSYLNDILKLNVVTFTHKNSSSSEKNLGLIAQEVEEVFPSIVKNVSYKRNLDDSGSNQVDENLKMVAYDAFVPMLINCVQEQQKQIKSLEERLKLIEDLLK
jgi:hypothetical protein